VTPGPVVAIGVDAGSTTCKLAAVDGTGALVAWRLEQATPRVELQSEDLLEELRAGTGAGPEIPVVATGYGRKMVRAATRDVTEITCHARGVFADLATPGTLVDIGGQDSKVIRIGPGGAPVDFAMNDKCAAGTGRFLEHTAGRLDVALDDLGPTALSADHEEPISSTCTVFAESEIISLIARGADLPAILLGLHRALISRILAMVRAVGLEPPLMLSGGVARNSAMRELLARESGTPLLLPSRPQLMGAYGAALVAARGLRADRPASVAVPAGGIGALGCDPACR
jgi:(R)-2-hydroxyacyl-CoA dehydratese activating ATPase